MNASIPVIADPKVTRHILNAFHLRASKRLGQNFLVDRCGGALARRYRA